VAIEDNGKVILIDTSTDLRQQALDNDINRVDAVLYTHAHADHLHGIDELRIFNLCLLKTIPCYAGPDVSERIEAYFKYIFQPEPGGSFRPYLELNEVDGPFMVEKREVIPIPLLHGQMPIFGYRIGDFAYLTDVSKIPDESWGLLDGLDLLILDALRPRPHPTHFSLDQALDVSKRLAPKRTAFTHLSHLIEHEETCKDLPEGVELAFDGMVFEL